MNLLSILSTKFPDSSNTTLRNLIRHRRVLVDGLLATKDIPITSVQSVTVLPKRRQVEGVTVFYADDHLIVVDKPEGLLSVATDFEERKTLHAMIKRSHPSVWPVQRLDRETSGVMVFALSFKAKEGLKEQFIEHSIYREYHALVDGQLKGKGTWQHHLSEDAGYVMHVAQHGELAITHYEALEEKRWQTRVKFVLETGKKNQIRAQSSHMGFPIVGDKKYGSRSTFLKRLALHAHRLEFIHPITEKRLSFISPTPF